jgi:hypothetical protein
MDDFVNAKAKVRKNFFDLFLKLLKEEEKISHHKEQQRDDDDDDNNEAKIG